MIDYHIHTNLCGHATGEMVDYVKEAIRCELDEIGFSDHLPLVDGKEKNLTMLPDELPNYVSEVMSLRKSFPEIRIKLGIEADYIPGNESYIKELIIRYPFDYVIGSVHYIDKWAFDHPKELSGWDERDVNAVYEKYFELLRKSARTSLFDIIGHCDLVKKFGHRPSTELTKDLIDTAKVFKEYGVALEINTSGLRKPVNEIYPSCEILKLYREYDIPIVFGSDAHTPDDVGRDFDRAVSLARQVAYEEFVTFENREMKHQKLDSIGNSILSL
ncbi:MAG: Histidinol-phosphatase [Candidatus Scalindua rubra]|uniref:Histidinol-phosphatase n=1 Tax=Candidatus Scalindua rubra TaxID=1872076 RepID=A0A1E3X4I9_9BACT|nr:MAG: Histidinol-phosphatase [Candidatus Scalindua rubra]